MPGGAEGPAGRTAVRRVLRPQLNRIVVVLSALVLLPAIVVAERIRPGTGRPVARRGVLFVARLCGVTFDVRGWRDDLAGSLFVANHSSPMDIPAMLVAAPDVRFVAAADLFRIPLLASAMRALGTVPLDRGHPEHARRQLADLARGWSPGDQGDLTIFPEGGIAPRGRQLPFKSGAFRLAVDTGTTVVPVVLRGTGEVLPPRQRLLVRPGAVVIDLLAPVVTHGMSGQDHQALRHRIEVMVAAARTDGPGAADRPAEPATVPPGPTTGGNPPDRA